MTRIVPNAKIFEMNGVTFALQLDHNPVASECELWELNKLSNEWQYTFDASGSRRPIFQIAPFLSPSLQMDFVVDGVKVYENVSFAAAVEMSGGKREFLEKHVIGPANKRFARRFPDGSEPPTVPPEVEGTLIDELDALLNGNTEVVGNRLILV